MQQTKEQPLFQKASIKKTIFNLFFVIVLIYGFITDAITTIKQEINTAISSIKTTSHYDRIVFLNSTVTHYNTAFHPKGIRYKGEIVVFKDGWFETWEIHEGFLPGFAFKKEKSQTIWGSKIKKLKTNLKEEGYRKIIIKQLHFKYANDPFYFNMSSNSIELKPIVQHELFDILQIDSTLLTRLDEVIKTMAYYFSARSINAYGERAMGILFGKNFPLYSEGLIWAVKHRFISHLFETISRDEIIPSITDLQDWMESFLFTEFYKFIYCERVDGSCDAIKNAFGYGCFYDQNYDTNLIKISFPFIQKSCGALRQIIHYDNPYLAIFNVQDIHSPYGPKFVFKDIHRLVHNPKFNKDSYKSYEKVYNEVVKNKALAKKKLRPKSYFKDWLSCKSSYSFKEPFYISAFYLHRTVPFDDDY
ncbi:hypothetical protein K502DRAFT_323496 [Neoconidiobolus thromboides FSU 785]|nr:hypothetical protein K502DRAFT_323496 [Neoconidiobolus thromboides FSU 785]